jgi:hypothetical protein
MQMRPFDESTRENGMDWPLFGFTMVGHKRLDNLRTCVETVLRDGIPGDFVETGIWRGGAVIWLRALLKCSDVHDRTIWAADSFAGLPKPSAEADKASPLYDLSRSRYLSVSLEQVQENIKKFGLLDDRIRFLEGWFKDTLPAAPIKTIAVLRLDGDLYESTMDSLNNLFHKTSPGGFVIIDDYFTWPPCKKAVDEFLGARGIEVEMLRIDQSGAYFRVPEPMTRDLQQE